MYRMIGFILLNNKPTPNDTIHPYPLVIHSFFSLRTARYISEFICRRGTLVSKTKLLKDL